LKLKKVISILLCGIMLFTCSNISVYAYTKDEVQKEIDRLEQQSQQIANNIKKLQKDKASQNKIKAELDKNIAILQQQIDICNEKISQTNASISANDKEIAKQREKMSGQVQEYKKRIRTLYMSGSTISGIEVLLGAEDFADFIALSQVSLNISRRDKRMVDGIVKVIEKIEEKIAENRKLIEEQKEIKATLDKKQDALDKEVAEVNKIIRGLNSDIASENRDNAQIQNELDQWNSVMAELSNPGGSSAVFNGTFTWPVPGFTNRTSDYGERWNRLHAGIDIAQAGIANAKVVAAASGTVTVYYSACTHNYGKYKNGSVYSCTNSSGYACGGGYGNYLKIEHGKYKGVPYRTVYAHLAPGSISVKSGQYVTKGTKVGRVGTTGRSTGYHLHFELRKDGVPQNPMDFY